MQIRRVLAAVSVGFRGRRLVWLAVIGSVFGYATAGNPLLRVVFALTCLGSAEVMILLETPSFVDNALNGFRLRRSVRWVAMPEMELLAKQVGVRIHRTKPFGVSSRPIGAVALPFSGQVIFGSDVLALPHEQKLAVAGHELNHLTNRQSLALLCGVVYIPVLGATLLIGQPAVLQWLAIGALFLLFRSFTSHALERGSDEAGNRIAPHGAMEAALRALVPQDRHGHETDSHPSVNARIRHLRRIECGRGLPCILRWLLPTSSLEEFSAWLVEDIRHTGVGHGPLLRHAIISAEVGRLAWRLGILARLR